MDADRDSNAPRPEISAHVASCVIRVRELDPSLKFYCDVFSLQRRGSRNRHGAAGRTQRVSHLLHAPSRRGRAANTAGVQYLLWATDTESDLQEFAQRLRAYDPAVFSHTENGVTVIEGLDPDGGRVLIGYPSPFQLPRTVIAAPACLTVRPEQVASTDSILLPTAAA